MWYRIDYKRLAELLLPTFLRRNIIISFLRVMIIPIIDIYNEFTTYKNAVSKRLDFNGQVMYLEKMLNEEFKLVSNTIYISDATTIPVLYLHHTAELQIPLYLWANKGGILIRKSEVDFSGDFIINVPVALNTAESMTKIKTIVDHYKYTGKRYKIIIYE